MGMTANDGPSQLGFHPFMCSMASADISTCAVQEFKVQLFAEAETNQLERHDDASEAVWETSMSNRGRSATDTTVESHCGVMDSGSDGTDHGLYLETLKLSLFNISYSL